MTGVQVDKVCKHLGYEPIIIERAEAISDRDPADMALPGEPLHGREAHLLDFITSKRPALIVFDLANKDIPWERWVPLIKSSPATRQIPILCYGPHVGKEAMDRAYELKADNIMPRSQFMSKMLSIFEQMAHPDNLDALDLACKDPISELAIAGLEAFNKGLYFEAHEYLEDAWNEDKSAARNVYKGVLQIAIAYYQIERNNYRGVIKMFLRSRQWLTPLPEVCRGIHIGRLREDAAKIHQKVLELGQAGLDSFDLRTLPAVHFQIGDSDIT